ncbi:MAG TPA: hybrid sensor histidine kinase/response regulator, partial [Cyanobacteria bacterium UBA12227]|nr:hybrid sensor histidine kinase/response regulator [Cyanobacteria bacterium UBA12227]
NYEVAGELRAQVEVFAGFAEFLNLPGFGAIAHAAQQALDTYPERALEITQLALADFELSKQAVLAGDSIQGGNPSAALLALVDSESATLPVMPMIEAVAETEWAIAQSESTIPWLETIFEANPDTVPFDLEAMPVAESSVTLPSLEPVLGSIIDGELVSEVTNLEEDEEELEPSVLSSEIAETPERVEVTLKSLDQLFESLVPIQDISALTSPLNSVGATSEKNQFVSAKLGESETSVDSSTSNNQRAAVSAANRQKVASSTPALSVRVDLDRLERMNNL